MAKFESVWWKYKDDNGDFIQIFTKNLKLHSKLNKNILVFAYYFNPNGIQYKVVEGDSNYKILFDALGLTDKDEKKEWRKPRETKKKKVKK